MNRQWLILGLSLLVLVPLAAQQGHTPPAKNSITVHDSKGKPLGVMIDASGVTDVAVPLPVVLLKTGQQLTTIGVRPDRLRGNYSGLLFTTLDCSGTPFLLFTGPSLIAFSYVTNDGTLYLSRASAPVKTVDITSYLRCGGELPIRAEMQSDVYELEYAGCRSPGGGKYL